MLSATINSVTVFEDGWRRTILRESNFVLEYGKIYTILGKNGSGKSTLIKSLTSLLPKSYEINGKVIFNEIDLLNCADDKLREIRSQNIRYVFQDAVNSFDPLKKLNYYFDLTNVSPLKIDELLLYFLLPNYKMLSGLHAYELSGGMAQRLLIVLALLANPNLLILDEPTSGVDYAAMNIILLKIKNYVRDKNKSVLVVTQDINFAMKASDKIACLSDGKLSEFFNSDEILTVEDTALKTFFNSFNELNYVSA